MKKNNPELNSKQRQSKSLPLLGTLTAAMLLTGCAGSLRHLPDDADISIPEQWETSEMLSDEASMVVKEAVVDGWVSSFADPKFEKFAQLALDQNPDIFVSAAQLNAAIRQVTITGSNVFPNVSVNGSRSIIETEGGELAVLPVVGQQTPQDQANQQLRNANASLAINWEADIWGRLSQRRKSAALDAKAQSELYRSAELSLVANVGRAWFNLITNKVLVDLAHQRLESFERTASIIEENYQRGLRSALDVYLSRSDVQVQISSLADAKFNYLQTLRAFKTLLGEYPGADMEFEASLPELASQIPVGLPAELMNRRPDIQASRYQYESARALAKAAQRDRLPALSFSGSVGDQREEIDQLFDNDGLVKNLVTSIALPIFRAGALRSRADQAMHQAEAAYGQLVRTSLTAFEEVENAISRETALKAQHEALKQAVDLAQGGLDLALDRYQSGIEDYQTVLQAQRSVFNSKLNEINVRNALLQNRITLHLALGGDFAQSADAQSNESEPVDLQSAQTENTETDAEKEA